MMKNLTLLATMVVSAVSIASSTHRSQKEMCRAAADELVGAGSQIEVIAQLVFFTFVTI